MNKKVQPGVWHAASCDSLERLMPFEHELQLAKGKAAGVEKLDCGRARRGVGRVGWFNSHQIHTSAQETSVTLYTHHCAVLSMDQRCQLP